MPENVIELATRLRAALESQNGEAVKRLVNAYTAILERLQGDIDALVLSIGDDMTPGQAQRLAQYARLMSKTIDELGKYGQYLNLEITQEMRSAILAAEKDARILVKASYFGNDAVMARWNTVPARVIETITGFLDPDGELYKRIDAMPEYTAEKVSRAIVEGVGLGRNPNVIARDIVRAFGGSLTDAIRMTRTAQIWSYREASRANYAANSDIVTGWVWNSALQPGRTCMSCVAMHGTEHPLSEPLNDHYNGLCSMVPMVIGGRNPITESGEAWFNQQSEATQRKMARSKYDLWKEGKVSLSDLTTERTDDVYGVMRGEPSLKELGLNLSN